MDENEFEDQTTRSLDRILILYVLLEIRKSPFVLVNIVGRKSLIRYS
jgi:hypothetical protein